MPHVIVKLWPGKSHDQKQRLTDSIVANVTSILGYGPGAVSVGIEEVAPDDWIAKVYEPDITGKWSSLTKPPEYGSRPRVCKEFRETINAE